MTELTDMQAELCERSETDYSDLSALFVNCTLKRSPEGHPGPRQPAHRLGCRLPLRLPEPGAPLIG